MKRLRTLILYVLMASCGGGSSGTDDGNSDSASLQPQTRAQRLAIVTAWMYQIDGLDTPASWQVLDEHPYQMLVLEPGNNNRPCSDTDVDDEACAPSYATQAMVNTLRFTTDGTERLLLAYIDIGQAENYRSYWQEHWTVPTETCPQSPDFIIGEDPDDWSGNYPVAFWRENWQALWLGPDGIVSELAALGFDGVYLDWVEAYDHEPVAACAAAEGVDPVLEMVEFIEKIRDEGRKRTPDFLVVVQNAMYLIDSIELSGQEASRYIGAIDGMAAEDTWFFGNGGAEEWDQGADPTYFEQRIQCEKELCLEDYPSSGLHNVCPEEYEVPPYEQCGKKLPVVGDLHGGGRHSEGWTVEDRLQMFDLYRSYGIPIFTADYCISTDKAAFVYKEARQRGLIPLVTRVTLSRHTETPPFDSPEDAQ